MLDALIDISNNECSQYYCKVITLGKHWCSMGIIVHRQRQLNDILIFRKHELFVKKIVNYVYWLTCLPRPSCSAQQF